MDALAITWGILGLLTNFEGTYSLCASKRMLKGKIEYLRASIDDIEDIKRAQPCGRVQRGKKRKRDYDLCNWVIEGRKLLTVAENFLAQVEGCDSLLKCTKMTKMVGELMDTLSVHEKKCDMLYSHKILAGGGPHSGCHIPVRDLKGRATFSTLAELEHLLHDTKVGRIAIHGREGIGKTCLMKHLHNRVLNGVQRFAYVFWVSTPVEFSIKHVQDAVAAVVKCDFSSDDDLSVRARELSKKLGDLGSFVLFLDGVPKADYSLDQIGIPVPAEGIECKLVVTTSSTALGCRVLDDFKTTEVGPLLEEEAYQLFLREAKVDKSSATLLNNIPLLLTRKCHGIPRMIVDTASHMCGIDDLHEWKFALFELENLEKRSKCNI